MHRYLGLLLVIVLAAVLYLIAVQLLPNIKIGDTLSHIIVFPDFQGSTSTKAIVSTQKGYVPPKASAPAVYTPPTYQPTITPPTGFTASELSPYYQKVRIGYVTPASYYGSASQISLNGDYSLKSGLDITGWRIKTNHGDVLVPQAIADYDPSGLASAGDLYLGSGQYVYIYSSYSPFGRNLRLNECTGFLNNNYNFVPALPNNCPYIDRSTIGNFSGVCQSYIFSLGNCSQPSPNDLNRFGGPNDLSCQRYLLNINYSGCYSLHRSDANFFSNEWRVWLGTNIPLDSQHDRVQLLDRQGLLVDLYSY